MLHIHMNNLLKDVKMESKWNQLSLIKTRNEK